MDIYRHRVTGRWPVAATEIIHAHRAEVSFPDCGLTQDIADALGYDLVQPADQPVCPLTHRVVEADPVLIDGQLVQQWQIVALTADELNAAAQALIQSIADKTQQRLDTFAAGRGYGDHRTAPIVSACSYATSNHPKYGAEGRYCVAIREATWDALYALMAAVKAGEAPMPAGFEDVEPLLPELTWPD